MPPTPWTKRVDAGDWDAIAAAVDDFGGALLPRLLTPTEARRLRNLFTDDDLFRSTVDMGPRRYGSGQYRYFRAPYPEPIEHLKQALYPRLLPIARDWWTRLGRDAPWPDSLDEWLDVCHAAGQTRSTALMLRYATDDWNALTPRPVRRLGVSAAGGDQPERTVHRIHRRGIHARRTTGAGPVTRHRNTIAAGPRLPVHHPRPAGPVSSRLVGRGGAARPIGRALGRAVRARPDLPRRRLTPRYPTAAVSPTA